MYYSWSFTGFWALQVVGGWNAEEREGTYSLAVGMISLEPWRVKAAVREGHRLTLRMSQKAKTSSNSFPAMCFDR